MAKCVLLLSGGLDSTLAGGMLRDMGVEVFAISFSSPFCTCTPKGLGCNAARKSAEQLGLPLRSLACGPDYLATMKRPRHGRGKGANACIDCRIHLFRKAGEYMQELGADFVATGEVLGERPMSQRRDAMLLIERESGLDGLVVRPLSARLLPPSKAEQSGLIDREQMLAIQGRRRLPQFELADKLGIKDYLCPGGGCMLTQKEFAAKFLDLVDNDPEFELDDALLLRQGRHFRLTDVAGHVVEQILA